MRILSKELNLQFLLDELPDMASDRCCLNLVQWLFQANEKRYIRGMAATISILLVSVTCFFLTDYTVQLFIACLIAGIICLFFGLVICFMTFCVWNRYIPDVGTEEERSASLATVSILGTPQYRSFRSLECDFIRSPAEVPPMRLRQKDAVVNKAKNVNENHGNCSQAPITPPQNGNSPTDTSKVPAEVSPIQKDSVVNKVKESQENQSQPPIRPPQNMNFPTDFSKIPAEVPPIELTQKDSVVNKAKESHGNQSHPAIRPPQNGSSPTETSKVPAEVPPIELSQKDSVVIKTKESLENPENHSQPPISPPQKEKSLTDPTQVHEEVPPMGLSLEESVVDKTKEFHENSDNQSEPTIRPPKFIDGLID